MGKPQLACLAIAFLATLCAAQNCNTDVMFILDASGSVEDNYKNMIDFARGISELLTIEPGGHRVSFLAYSGRHTKILAVPFGVIQSNAQFDLAVDNLPYYKSTTYTGRALIRALELMEDRDSNTVVLVVTDGYSSDDVNVPAAALRSLPRTSVYVAAIPDLISKSGMRAISGDSGRVFFQPGVLAKATAALKAILACTPFRDPVTRPPTPRPTPPPTTRRVTARPTTTTPRPTTTTQRVTGCELDLLFIFDFSGSVSGIHESYVRMALEIVDEMRVGPFYTRIGLVKYSSRAWAHPVFHFRDHETAQQVKSAISGTEYMGGTTDTNRALETAAVEFAVKWGARPGLAKMAAVIFTDGYSQADPRPGAEALRGLGVELFAVCTELDDYPPNFEELGVIAGKKESVFESKDVRRLKAQLKTFNSGCR